MESVATPVEEEIAKALRYAKKCIPDLTKAIAEKFKLTSDDVLVNIDDAQIVNYKRRGAGIQIVTFVTLSNLPEDFLVADIWGNPVHKDSYFTDWIFGLERNASSSLENMKSELLKRFDVDLFYRYVTKGDGVLSETN